MLLHLVAFVTSLAFPAMSAPQAAKECTDDFDSARVLIRAHRSGGFVGYNDCLTVNRDGALLLTRRVSVLEGRMPAEEFKKLIRLVEDVSRLPQKTDSQATECCDRIGWTLMTGSTRMHVTEDTAPSPVALLTATLTEIIESLGKAR